MAPAVKQSVESKQKKKDRATRCLLRQQQLLSPTWNMEGDLSAALYRCVLACHCVPAGIVLGCELFQSLNLDWIVQFVRTVRIPSLFLPFRAFWTGIPLRVTTPHVGRVSGVPTRYSHAAYHEPNILRSSVDTMSVLSLDGTRFLACESPPANPEMNPGSRTLIVYRPHVS